MFLFTCIPSFAKEYANLYLIKDIQKVNLDNFAQGYFLQNNYEYKEKDGYFVTLAEYQHKVLIKQNAQDCYFYVVSNTKEDKFSKKLLKQIKNSGLKTKKIKNDELRELFYNDSKLITFDNDIVNEQGSDIYTFYDFSDEAQAEFDASDGKYEGLKPKGRKKLISENKNTQDNWQENIYTPSDIKIDGIAKIEEGGEDTELPFSTLRGQIIQIPKGETISAVLQSSINSQSVSANDIITAVLNYDWIYKNNLIAPAGSILYGRVVDAQKAGYAYGNGEIEITFTEMLTLDGQKFNLASNRVRYTSEINRSVKITSQVITGALFGVASGVLYALISGGDVARGLAIGAGVGGAGGLIKAGVQKGEEIEIASGANLEIKFLEAMKFAPSY